MLWLKELGPGLGESLISAHWPSALYLQQFPEAPPHIPGNLYGLQVDQGPPRSLNV